VGRAQLQRTVLDQMSLLTRDPALWALVIDEAVDLQSYFYLRFSLQFLSSLFNEGLSFISRYASSRVALLNGYAMKKSPNTPSPAPPSAGSRVGRSSNASMRPPSFVSIRGFSLYRGLSQLIQLDPSAPLDWFAKQNETSHQSNHVHHQPSLLDLDDNQDQQHAGVPGPGDQYAQRERQLEADYKLAKALQEELNSADQEGRPLRCARCSCVIELRH
jgi:hypothetical protein